MVSLIYIQNSITHCLSRKSRSIEGSKSAGGRKCLHTTKLSMLEFLLERGLAIVTSAKKHLNWEYRRETFFPRKIFAIKVPPCLRMFVVMLSAERRSWACMYSSISCMPVTSGAGGRSGSSSGDDDVNKREGEENSKIRVREEKRREEKWRKDERRGCERR